MSSDGFEQDPDLDALREQLLIFILDEMGKRVGTVDDVNLPAALAHAIDREVALSLERRLAKADLPDPQVFRDMLFDAAQIGAKSQALRDQQLDAIANRLAVVTDGIEQLLERQGVAFDPDRTATDEELARLKLSRGRSHDLEERGQSIGNDKSHWHDLIKWGGIGVAALVLLSSGPAIVSAFLGEDVGERTPKPCANEPSPTPSGAISEVTTDESDEVEDKVTHDRIRSVIAPALAEQGLSNSKIKDPSSAIGKAEAKAMADRIFAAQEAVQREINIYQSKNPSKSVPDGFILSVAVRQLTPTRRDDDVPTEGMFFGIGSNAPKYVPWFERRQLGSNAMSVQIPPAEKDRLRCIVEQSLGRPPTDKEIANAYFQELRE